MRLSVLPDSPFYDPQRAMNTECYVDGVKIQHCAEACEEEGWALVSVRDEHGRAVLTEDRTDIKREYVYGRVELREKVRP